MIKSISLLALALTFNFSFSQNSQKQSPGEIIYDALNKAKKENKQVFVNNFSTESELSDEIKKQMTDGTYETAFNNNYIVVNIVIPKEETSSFLTCSNPVKTFTGNNCKQVKFPFWYIIDNTGKFVANEDTSIEYPTSMEDKIKFNAIIKSYSNSKIADNNNTNSFQKVAYSEKK